jgi:catechol 2,3-dioxygenase-like lactoylglutathione lyase family enzyme
LKCWAGYLAAFLSLAFPLCVSANEDVPVKPKILGIFMVQLSVTDASAFRQFYPTILDEPQFACHWCETEKPGPIILSSGQILAFGEMKRGQKSHHVVRVVFAIDNADAMRTYLKAKNIKIEDEPMPTPLKKNRSSKTSPHSNFVHVLDPEGNHIEFWQLPSTNPPHPRSNDLRIIHYGIIVKDVAAEDHFYRDVLGFHLYWHGGRTEGRDDWVAMQVPDGTDWVEFMLNIPADASERMLGVASHIAIGVTDIHDTYARLMKDGVEITEEPALGLDGKWQLNVYDHDQTRVEFMEFKPKAKPCCSDFTGTHPGPK